MDDEPVVRRAETEADAARCWPAMQELRPHLSSPEEFLQRWRQQSAEGYQLAFIEAGESVVAVAGYRLLHTMTYGRILNLDDLIALPAARGQGLGSSLLRFVQAEAVRLDCTEVHLNTGFQRHDAHRSYLRNGFDLSCHHLAWKRTGRE
ncbi:GNAT family N-acetyltransferase [Kribbella monticola]|uniref:GNAT family N-acetyltransferase n=1 Tax=Kribbella monticola TaxID=2185285 RepID=UPI0018E56C09|nr:GNAT family N-acetyltransferase [Kribbella monticola]